MKSFTFRDVRMFSRLMCGSYPFSYPLLKYSLPKEGFAPNKIKMVNAKTDICIDGFPHSGNTFFTRLVKYWNKELTLARHMHVPYQIIRSANDCIPTLVLIREPGNALSSLLYRYPDLHPYTACTYYYMFYKKILPWKEQFLVVKFEALIKDPVVYLKRANERFDCSLQFEDYSENVEEIIIRKVPGKVEKKKEVGVIREREKIEDELKSMKIFQKASIVYQEYVDNSI